MDDDESDPVPCEQSLVELKPEMLTTFYELPHVGFQSQVNLVLARWPVLCRPQCDRVMSHFHASANLLQGCCQPAEGDRDEPMEKRMVVRNTSGTPIWAVPFWNSVPQIFADRVNKEILDYISEELMGFLAHYHRDFVAGAGYLYLEEIIL